MRIAIENRNNAVPVKELRKVLVAINQQLAVFGRFWSTTASCQVGFSSTADATVYLQREVDVQGALGYHAINAAGRPFGVVFTALSQQLGEPWSVTLSHEVLEIVADPEANRYAVGMHPNEDRTVFYWYEVCDPVQQENYAVAGVQVSNFVLPLYFTANDEPGTLLRNDFLRITGQIRTPLSSLWLAPGGYAGFFDPEVGQDLTVFADARATERNQIKQAVGMARRAAKYTSRHT